MLADPKRSHVRSFFSSKNSSVPVCDVWEDCEVLWQHHKPCWEAEIQLQYRMRWGYAAMVYRSTGRRYVGTKRIYVQLMILPHIVKTTKCFNSKYQYGLGFGDTSLGFSWYLKETRGSTHHKRTAASDAIRFFFVVKLNFTSSIKWHEIQKCLFLPLMLHVSLGSPCRVVCLARFKWNLNKTPRRLEGRWGLIILFSSTHK